MAGDRIDEAFEGKLGDELRDSTKIRLAWMLEQIHGENVLDVGCSQGTFSILAASKGFLVDGIDNDHDAIEYANNKMDEHFKDVSGRVTFIEDDFLFHQFDGKKYDTIVLGEILEHLREPELFIENSLKLLNEGGRVVASVPFGINRYWDHKKTYYFCDLFNLLNKKLSVVKIKFMGKWMAMVAEIDDSKSHSIQFDLPFLREYDKAIEILDLTYEKKTNSALNEVNTLRDGLSRKEIELKKIENKLIDVEAREKQIELLQEELSSCKNVLEKTVQLNIKEKDFLNKLRLDMASKDNKIADLQKQNSRLNDENREFSRKIGIIHNTWYGKLGEGFYLKLRDFKRKHT